MLQVEVAALAAESSEICKCECFVCKCCWSQVDTCTCNSLSLRHVQLSVLTVVEHSW